MLECTVYWCVQYQALLVQWEEDMSQFTFRLDAVKSALVQNQQEYEDIKAGITLSSRTLSCSHSVIPSLLH